MILIHPGGYWDDHGKWYAVWRLSTTQYDWWKVAKPEDWTFMRRYFWPAKGVSLSDLSDKEWEHLAPNYIGWSYD